MGKRNARIREEQEAQAYEQGRQAAAAAPAAAPAAAAPAAAPGETGGEVTTRLAELGKLHDQGVLTDEEFAQAKAKLLGL
jgi:hypothetical protein